MTTTMLAASTWWSVGAGAVFQSTLVAAVVLAIVQIGRRLPSPFRHALLVIALLKFAVPPVPIFQTGLLALPNRVVSPLENPSHSRTTRDSNSSDSATQQPSPYGWLLLAYLAGSVVVISIQSGRLMSVRRRVASSELVPSGVTLDGWARGDLVVSSEESGRVSFSELASTGLVRAGLCEDRGTGEWSSKGF